MMYRTRQRDTILACLAEHAGQTLSAKEVYSLCRQRDSGIGLATVYRQLKHLTEERRINKFITDDNKGIRFQHIGEQAQKSNLFLKCDCCGRIENANCRSMEQMAEHMNETHGFAVDTTKSILYGRCQNCR